MEGKPVSPLSDESRSLLVNCPVCRRVMWRNGTCSHGQVPPPVKGVVGGILDAIPLDPPVRKKYHPN